MISLGLSGSKWSGISLVLMYKLISSIKANDPNGAIDKRTGQIRLRLIWAVDLEKAEVVKWIFDEYLQGNGLKRLADKLNQKGITGARGGSWAGSAIREMLRNQSYIGWFCLGKHRRTTWPDGKKTYLDKDISEWRIYKDVHDPIISRICLTKFKNVISSIAKNYHHFSHSKSDHSRYLLTGLLNAMSAGRNLLFKAPGRRLVILLNIGIMCAVVAATEVNHFVLTQSG